MNRLKITDKTKCTGCGACHNICPCNAITMCWDEEGFPYPKISDQCIDCGKCVQVCPLINSSPIYGQPLESTTVYAAWSNNDECRIQSTSGGLFSELALRVYEQDGVVVGAVYDENFAIHHKCSQKETDLSRLRQSKYAESDIRLVFREIKTFLKHGRSVLFCGTPCQAAGLRSYLGSVPENLLLCDFICHGVSSPKAYAAYLKMLEKRYDSKVKKVHFKNKDEGWNRFHTKVTFLNGAKHHQDRFTDPFMQAYLRYNLLLRPSCHACCFKGKNRNVDLTLGDFWGVGKYAPELDENRGTSVIIASTLKGKEAFKSLGDRVVSRVMEVEQVHGGNPCLTRSVPPGPNRDKFLSKIDKLGYEKAMKRYGRDPVRTRISYTYARIKHLMKRIMGKLFG